MSEKQNILNVKKSEDIARINHIGSSAVEGLIAKPTIDILLEINDCCTVTKLVEDLKAIGYGDEIFTRSDEPMRWLLGSKGYSSDGYAEKVYHLHVIIERIANGNPNGYSQVKLEIVKKYTHLICARLYRCYIFFELE